MIQINELESALYAYESEVGMETDMFTTLLRERFDDDNLPELTGLGKVHYVDSGIGDGYYAWVIIRVGEQEFFRDGKNKGADTVLDGEIKDVSKTR